MPSVGPVLPRLSAGLSMSPPIIRGPFRASVLCAPVRRAPSPASLGPYDASGEARAVNRHGTSPFVKRSVGRKSARVLQADGTRRVEFGKKSIPQMLELVGA